MIQQAITATEASVKDPKQLVRHVNDLNKNAQTAVRALQACPIFRGQALKSQKFAAGVTNYISHGLGRAYQGYFVTRASASGTVALLTEQALKAGQTSDKFIALLSAVNGTFDIWVF